ncbi:hypothetical protein QBC38DRAFT_287194 [Podospora fimiseda]|uniref:RNA-binding protein vts1-like alpha-helical domain-containing protein n=1 Tax=Podospora fimiseda TaxID=252190 RepID=A0AAN7BK72_9PEZI|nr:hypothetical protein QBC38DRAFT_287194 [Podospora fimiseda]
MEIWWPGNCDTLGDPTCRHLHPCRAINQQKHNHGSASTLSMVMQHTESVSEAERTAALYALLQQTTQVQIRFFIKVLTQMGKNHAVLWVWVRVPYCLGPEQAVEVPPNQDTTQGWSWQPECEEGAFYNVAGQTV